MISMAACVLDVTPGRAYAPPSQALLSLVGVLRRAATPANALPKNLRPLGASVRYARRARVVAGRSYYVIPALYGRCKPFEPWTGVLLWEGRHHRSSVDFWSVQSVEQGKTVNVYAVGRQTVVAGVVPNGVATVTLDYPARPTLPAVGIRTQVVHNVVVVNVPRARARATATLTATWQSANGTTIKTIDGGQ